MKDRLLGIVNIKNRLSGPPAAPSPPADPVGGLRRFRFTVPGDPMGKPRMTRRDKWQTRPCVLRYREYCDRIRTAAGRLPEGAVLGIIVFAYLAIPESWPKAKKLAFQEALMRQRPDWDNIGKAVCDALFEEDSCLGGGVCWKFWTTPEQSRTEVSVLYWHG